MRRARSKLQVSTFPFLAVLLAAMGALIFLLLVMDRRSKVVARNKGREMMTARHEARRKEAAEQEALRLAVLRAQEEELLRRQEAVESSLTEKEKALRGELAKVKGDLIGAAAGIKIEKAEALRLLREQEGLRLALTLATKDLEGKRHARTLTKEQEDAARATVAKMAAELAGLEKLVRDLKARPKRENVFSLVPYRGKHGENRKPIYVECSTRGLTFPTTGRSLSLLELDPGSVRLEVQKAGLALIPKKESDTTGLPSTEPYVLCLVRPDGIESYDRIQNALNGYAIDFGYELVDADWALDYSAEGVAGTEEPLTKLADRGPPPGLPGLPVAGPGPGGTANPGGPFPPRAGAGPPLSGPPLSGPGIGGPGLPSLVGAEASGGSARKEVKGGVPPGARVPGDKVSGGKTGPGGGASEEGKSGGSPDVAWRGSKVTEPGSGKNPEGTKPGAGDELSSPPGSGRFSDPLAKASPRPASLGHLLSNREFLIVIGCKENEAALSGTGLRFATEGSPAEQGRSAQALRDSIRNMIARRHASLRPGEPPYRPTIRFQVHPGGLRTYYQIYPPLVDLGVPLQRENVE